MSIQIPMSSLEEVPRKRSKSTKRKHQDTSPALLTDSQSPSKKAKHASSASPPRVSQSKRVAPLDATQNPTPSPFRLKRLSLYLSMPPIAMKYPKEGLIAEHLSPLLLTYYPPLHGVVMAINNISLTDGSGKRESKEQQRYAVAVAEHCGSFTWLTADFLVLEPPRGAQIEGYVNAQSEGHLGLVCWNLFNATISANRLPKDWKFIGGPSQIQSRDIRIAKLKDPDVEADMEADGALDNGTDLYQEAKAMTVADEQQGYWVDGEGHKINGGLVFRVVMIDADGGNSNSNNFVNLVGTLLEHEAEQQLVREEREAWERRHSQRKLLDRKKTKSAIEQELLRNGHGHEHETEISDQTPMSKSHKEKQR